MIMAAAPAWQPQVQLRWGQRRRAKRVRGSSSGVLHEFGRESQLCSLPASSLLSKATRRCHGQQQDRPQQAGQGAQEHRQDSDSRKTQRSAEDTQDRQAPPRPQTHEAVHGQTRKPTTYGWFNLHQQVNAHQLQLSCARAQHAYRDSSPLLPWV